MRTATGAPYSGEEVNEMVQTLADGTRITRNMPSVKTFRDSAGRTRTERPMMMGPIVQGRNAPNLIIVEIYDPVAQAKYVLDPIRKIAHRQQITNSLPNVPRQTAGTTSAGGGGGGGSPVPAGIISAIPTQAPPSPNSQPVRPQMSSEKLGTQMIEGLLAEGVRGTTTWSAGSQGNDRPITSTYETWVSVDLNVQVLSKNSDPRSGESTRKLINVSRSEPDPALFQPPPDYQVVEEKSEFTIEWGSGPR